MSESASQNKFNVPFQVTDLSIFDDAFFTMKERFAAEMKRLDIEMNKFSSDLMRLYGQAASTQSGVTSSQRDSSASSWDTITSSPLIEGEGENRCLKLQFDVSQFNPNEVKVKIQNNTLIVTANHEEKTNNSTSYRQYNKEILLPKGTDPQAIVSSLSKDGVLTVQAPLPHPALLDKPVEKTGSK